MAEKRKDSKGRNLLTGESERKDGTYMYRYTDSFGKRHSIYAPTLNELRKKEKQIQKDLDDGIGISGANTTVSQLLDKYMRVNKGWRSSTLIKKIHLVDVIKRDCISQMRISDVKTSHIKNFYLSLHNKGLQTKSIIAYSHVLSPAFEMAVQDDWIRKNPCKFKLDFLPTNEKKKVALTPEEEKLFLTFVKETKSLSWYYDIYVLMIETGIRLSELCGLTLNDVNMNERKLSIKRQMSVPFKLNGERKLRIESLKTECGERDIFISDRAYESLGRLLNRRKENNYPERIIDGHSNFLLTSNKQSGIVTHAMIDYNLGKAVTLYNDTHKKSLPNITAHMFRHTFCTRMIEKGIDVKTLQYIMGHADIKTTLDIYTHMSSDIAVKNMMNVVSK